MFRWLRKRRLIRRTVQYISLHPEDEPAADAILLAALHFYVDNPRHAAEMLAGREFTDDEWEPYRARWERAWYAIVGF